MRFSVVVPLYNKENCIRMTLESVKKQSFKDYEVIVVDDGSTDCSLEEARKIKSENITIIHQQNQGVSVARNTGILHAQGQYIAFLDADDEWEPDYLKTIDHLIEKYPESDMYVTAYRIDMGNGKEHYSARLTPADTDNYVLSEKMEMDYAPRKIKLPDSMIPQESFAVQKHHLDTNHHVNNCQYICMAEDFLPEDFKVYQMRAEYKMQAKLGDTICPKTETEAGKVVVSLNDENGKPYAVVEFTEK